MARMVLGRASSYYLGIPAHRFGTDDIQLLLLGDYAYVIGSGITIIAGILLFLFITKITKKQHRRILELV